MVKNIAVFSIVALTTFFSIAQAGDGECIVEHSERNQQHNFGSLNLGVEIQKVARSSKTNYSVDDYTFYVSAKQY